jgi:hypothetical protein
VLRRGGERLFLLGGHADRDHELLARRLATLDASGHAPTVHTTDIRVKVLDLCDYCIYIRNTLDEPLDARQQRALAIVRGAKAKRIKHVAGSTWLVPSATNTGGYAVDVAKQTCSCPDHEDRGVRCKHLCAVAYFRQEIALPDGTTVVTEQRVTYRQDWPAYNAAQCEEKDRVQLLLKGLCDGIVQPPRKPGAGRTPARLADVVLAAAMKTYGTLSGRRSSSDLRACAPTASNAAIFRKIFQSFLRSTER